MSQDNKISSVRPGTLNIELGLDLYVLLYYRGLRSVDDIYRLQLAQGCPAAKLGTGWTWRRFVSLWTVVQWFKFYRRSNFRCLHCAISLAEQCIVIGPVCGGLAGGWAGGRAGGRRVCGGLCVCLWVCYHDNFDPTYQKTGDMWDPVRSKGLNTPKFSERQVERGLVIASVCLCVCVHVNNNNNNNNRKGTYIPRRFIHIFILFCKQMSKTL